MIVSLSSHRYMFLHVHVHVCIMHVLCQLHAHIYRCTCTYMHSKCYSVVYSLCFLTELHHGFSYIHVHVCIPTCHVVDVYILCCVIAGAVNRLLYHMLKDNALQKSSSVVTDIKHCSLTSLSYGYHTYFEVITNIQPLYVNITVHIYVYVHLSMYMYMYIQFAFFFIDYFISLQINDMKIHLICLKLVVVAFSIT